MFDMFHLPFMVQAFVAAAITGILLSYLGVHVVGRGIVFVDLGAGPDLVIGCCLCCFYRDGNDFHPLDLYPGRRFADVVHKYS